MNNSLECLDMSMHNTFDSYIFFLRKKLCYILHFLVITFDDFEKERIYSS